MTDNICTCQMARCRCGDAAVWIVNMTGSDGPWNAHSFQQVQEDVYNACRATVDDCEQEINEGGFFASDDVRLAVTEELYLDTMTRLNRELAAHDGLAFVTVDPWYAKAQRCTFTIKVHATTEQEVYGA